MQEMLNTGNEDILKDDPFANEREDMSTMKIS